MQLKSEQQVFDTVIKGFIKQGKPAQDYNAKPINHYRLKVGTRVYKSAIGHVLQMKEYRTDIEGKAPFMVIKRYEHLRPYRNLLLQLEKMHDDYLNVMDEKDWKEYVEEQAREIADKFELSPSAIPERVE